MDYASPESGCCVETASAHQTAVERVVDIMRSRVDDRLTLSDLAEMAAFSPYHFHRVFRSVTGIPPGEFLGALRLNRAKQLLITTALSVTEVCFEVGYSSLGTFTTRFTQHVGLPPRSLRRLAESEIRRDLDAFRDEAPVPASGGAPAVAGHIRAPAGFAGPVFVGLFPTPIPQGRPAGGVLLSRPGPYRIDGVPDGRYFMLVAAPSWSDNPMQFLLPGGDMLVGTGDEPVVIHGGRSACDRDVELRPLTPLDPPILIALPILLAGKVRELAAAS